MATTRIEDKIFVYITYRSLHNKVLATTYRATLNGNQHILLRTHNLHLLSLRQSIHPTQQRVQTLT